MVKQNKQTNKKWLILLVAPWLSLVLSIMIVSIGIHSFKSGSGQLAATNITSFILLSLFALGLLCSPIWIYFLSKNNKNSKIK